MNKPSISVTFFYHSCVAVESSEAYLLFDYFLKNPAIKIPFPGNKKFYILSSHGHHDHYSPDIFNDDFAPDPVSYVLSHDIKDTPSNKSILRVEPYQAYTLDNLSIKTFGTTDIGVSFLVTMDGFQLFHSGDLNWWHWKHFSKEKQELEKNDFQSEIAKLPKDPIDLAFVPVDPRLEDASYLAAHYFINKLKPKYFVPIHLHTDFQVMKNFAKTVNPTHSQILTFEKTGETKHLSTVPYLK